MIKSHAGYAAIEKYYIEWYKTGVQPTVAADTLYYFYRTHPKALVASQDVNNIVTRGEVRDEIYVTTNLVAAAILRVTSGGRVSEYAVPMGMSHTRIPFRPGAQSFDLGTAPPSSTRTAT